MSDSTPVRTRLLLLAPAALIAALAALFDLGPIPTGLLLGASAFAMLAAARIPTPVAFGALALAGSVAFGFMTAVLAELSGQAVQDLLARPWRDSPVAHLLGMLAVAFAALGIASVVRGRWPPRRPESSPRTEPRATADDG